MTLFTGIDMVSVNRIRKSLQNPRFQARVFSVKERAFFSEKKDPAPSAAGNFAAKEAFSKALGTGVRGFSLSEVSVLRDRLGAPYFELSGRALACVEERGLSLSLSITHTQDTAAAFVVAFKEGERP